MAASFLKRKSLYDEGQGCEFEFQAACSFMSTRSLSTRSNSWGSGFPFILSLMLKCFAQPGYWVKKYQAGRDLGRGFDDFAAHLELFPSKAEAGGASAAQIPSPDPVAQTDNHLCPAEAYHVDGRFNGIAGLAPGYSNHCNTLAWQRVQGRVDQCLHKKVADESGHVTL